MLLLSQPVYFYGTVELVDELYLSLKIGVFAEALGDAAAAVVMSVFADD